MTVTLDVAMDHSVGGSADDLEEIPEAITAMADRATVGRTIVMVDRGAA